MWRQTYIVGYRAHIVGYRVATDLHCDLYGGYRSTLLALRQILWAIGWPQTYIVGFKADIVGYRVATDLHCGL